MRLVGIALRLCSLLMTVLAVVVTANGVAAQPPAVTVQGVGLQTPESVLYDAAEDVYLVSNINGSPTAADGNGFISRIGPEGQVLALKWIDGTVSGVTFLNDAAAGPDGSVYATDSAFTAAFSPSGSDAVYRIDRAGALTTIARGTHLRNPNGITVLTDGTVLLVGGGNDGELFALGPGGQRVNVRRLPAGGLDGVEALPGGVLLVSSWGASAVFRVAADGRAEAVVSNVRSPADIGYDGKRNRVLIPLFQDNRIVIQALR